MLPQKPVEQGLEISRTLTDMNGAAVSEVALGDEVIVTITMRAHNNKELADMAIVELLPGGFEMVENSLKAPENLPKDTTAWEMRAKDIREDRVVMFGTVMPYASVMQYKIKAVNAGAYTVPPAFAESMYERSIRAMSVPGKIIVK